MKKLKKSLLLILVLILSVILLAGCGDDEESSSSGSKKKKNRDEENNISTSVTSKDSALDKVESEFLGLTERGDYVVKLKNNNSKDIYIENATINFFDNNGTFAETCYMNSTYFCIPANKELITYVSGSGRDFSKYSKGEIELSTDEPFYEYRTNIDVEANNTGSQIAVTATNNSDIDLDDIEVNVVFYKDGKIVGISDGITNYGARIEKNGGNGYINVSYPYDKNYNDVTFDSIETYVVAAYAREK